MIGKIGIVIKVRGTPGHPYNPQKPDCSYASREELLAALVEQRGLPGAAHGVLLSNGATPDEMEACMDIFQDLAAARLLERDFGSGLDSIFNRSEASTKQTDEAGLQEDFCKGILAMLTRKGGK